MENINQPNETPNETPDKSPKETPNTSPLEDQSFREIFRELWRRTVDFVQDITDIQEGSDQVGTINSIMANKTMTGANVWLLISAIIVASIGLDTNSPAVIIGAMLISPLMSPILGVGLSVAINNRNTLRTSLQHFGIALGVSLVTSFLYFRFTPLSSAEPTSEMLARTSPTILDVLIAFFGGIAGIVSTTRLEKSNAIPGVAIATALLPPVCVSGYGLAHGEWWIFINALYLFFINSVFVALATFLIVRLLDFPYKQYINEQEKFRAQLIMVGFVILVIVPSAFIFSSVLKDIRQQHYLKEYVKENFDDTFTTTDKLDGTDSLELNVFWFGKPMIAADSLQHAKQLSSWRIAFRVVQSDYGEEFANSIRRSMQSEELMQALSDERKSKERLINEKNELAAQIEFLKADQVILDDIGKEYKITFPELQGLSYGTMYATTDSTCLPVPTLSFRWSRDITKNQQTDYEKRIATQFRERFELDTIIVNN
ncbi:MAG: DUF389 domain-containing protein [Saprospiraceae bacterium]